MGRLLSRGINIINLNKYFDNEELIIEGFQLLADKTKDEMSSLSPESNEWCDLAEVYIHLTRNINHLNGKESESENN